MGDRRILWVEGKSDAIVFSNLFQHHGLPHEFSVVAKDSVDAVLPAFRVQLKASDLECFGIVVDAETDLDARWRSVSNTLAHAGYSGIPEMPTPDGTVVVGEELPRFGIWIMPDNVMPGMLEHFVEFLVPSDDVLWPRDKACVDDIPGNERLLVEQHRIKAQIHTWLAWQQEPGTPMGAAITKRYLDADSEHARRFINWVRRLFID